MQGKYSPKRAYVEGEKMIQSFNFLEMVNYIDMDFKHIFRDAIYPIFSLNSFSRSQCINHLRLPFPS